MRAPTHPAVTAVKLKGSMTKKTTLKWRLAERPTVEAVRDLVAIELLTKEEARDILFSAETEETRDSEAYCEEIKFLRGLVDKLSKNQVPIVIREIERLKTTPHRYDWYQPYFISTAGTTLTTTGQYSATSAIPGAINAFGSSPAMTSTNFSAIN